MALSFLRSWAKAVRFLAITLVGFLIAMAVSFVLVRGHVRETGGTRPPDAATIEKAEQLRLLANGLLELADLYVREVARSDKPAAPATRQWTDREFGARLNGFRLRVGDLAASYALPEQELRIVENAAARLRAMA
ncbi:MAG TPA: hypothetical protein PKI11_17920, partial [Candidatus Hydrogenedentes bacterium]|nr:hypothetical protein [Candidatus Hydrogenedentota bacterium]